MGTILIVDDDLREVEFLLRVVRRHGWLVQIATNGDDALATIRSGAFSAVILDNRMPGMSGLDVLTELCAQHHGPPLPTPPIAVYTGDAHVAQRALDLGATCFIDKARPEMIDAFLRRLRVQA